MNNASTYREIKPIEELNNFVHSFWMHKNLMDKPEKMTIFPDSYFKLVITVKNDNIVEYFMTGLWTKEKLVIIPPKAISFGCRLKILAPEFLLNKEVASILQSYNQLDLQYLNVDTFNFSDFNVLAGQWQQEFLKIKLSKTIQGNKLRLSQLLDKMNGDIPATEVSNQIYWTNRQINRYLKKYVGVSLKKYLNIQKCYQSYLHIRKGEFYPENGFYDQSHFIREIKKHTGETPKSLHEHQNDRFIQLKRIEKK